MYQIVSFTLKGVTPNRLSSNSKDPTMHPTRFAKILSILSLVFFSAAFATQASFATGLGHDAVGAICSHSDAENSTPSRMSVVSKEAVCFDSAAHCSMYFTASQKPSEPNNVVGKDEQVPCERNAESWTGEVSSPPPRG